MILDERGNGNQIQQKQSELKIRRRVCQQVKPRWIYLMILRIAASTPREKNDVAHNQLSIAERTKRIFALEKLKLKIVSHV